MPSMNLNDTAILYHFVVRFLPLGMTDDSCIPTSGVLFFLLALFGACSPSSTVKTGLKEDGPCRSRLQISISMLQLG